MTSTDKGVMVTQGAREAAAEAMRVQLHHQHAGPTVWIDGACNEVAAGHQDQSSIVQAFARFEAEVRQSAQADAVEIVRELGEALEGMVTDEEDDPCWVDHHGYCQAHGLNNPCEMAVARTALAKLTDFLARGDG